jgi:hypothetical protein
MATGKTHTKNGFEYHCERYYEMVTWYFRPAGSELWIGFQPPEGKALKADMEQLLLDPAAAQAHYDARLDHISDVPRAEAELAAATREVDRVNDPDYGTRRNNPNKDSQMRKHARMRLEGAEYDLKMAKQYAEKLGRKFA